jgi:hypothetical protein
MPLGTTVAYQQMQACEPEGKEVLRIAATRTALSRREQESMFHTVEFTCDLTADLETSPKHHLKPLLLRRGVRRRAQIRPFVTQTEDGPVEAADLFFDDGTATRSVPFACFRFVE